MFSSRYRQSQNSRTIFAISIPYIILVQSRDCSVEILSLDNFGEFKHSVFITVLLLSIRFLFSFLLFYYANLLLLLKLVSVSSTNMRGT